MGFFSFIETFFFISLAITFILILLLVYHFKERLVIVEQKNDKMLSIINGLMQEVTSIKRGYILSQAQRQMPSFNTTSMRTIEEIDEQEDEGDDEQEEQEDDDEQGDEEINDDEDEGDRHYEFRKIEVSDTEADLEDDTVKIINVPILSNLDDSIESSDEEEMCDMNEIALDDLHEELNTLEPIAQIEEDSILVKKIDGIDSLEEIEKYDTVGKKNDFKRMDVSVLRTMVISRGLATDTKKMKKQDLIRLLEEEL